jgi:hypothetical protein
MNSKIQIPAPAANLTMVMRKILPACIALAAVTQTAELHAADLRNAGTNMPVPAVFTGQRFTDDFTQTSDAWWHGGARHHAVSGSLPLSAREPRMTLSPTVVNPENLTGFTARFLWNFGGKGERVLRIGWGKPFEFSALSECVERLNVGADGAVTVFADGKQIGEDRVTVGATGEVAIMVSRLPASIVLTLDGREAAFPVPRRERGGAGYFTMQAGGFGRSDPPVKLQRVELECEGNRPPWTEAERRQARQLWAERVLAENRTRLAEFETYLETERAAKRWGFDTDLTVTPGLVRPGEEVCVSFRCKGTVPEKCAAHVEPDYLSAMLGTSQPIPLVWRERQGEATAVFRLRPERCGNWRVVWQAGDETLSRVFAVADRGYTVCRFLITNDKYVNADTGLPGTHDAIHEAGLAADYWDGAEWTSPFSRSRESLVAYFGRRAAFAHRWGDRFMPMCNANWMLPGCPDSNLFRLPDCIQLEGLNQISRLWDLLGIGPMDVFASYTFGHSTPRLARRAGVKMIDSLVQWQNWRDGGDDNAWLINQWGAPTVPYYVADDDYRKVAEGRSIVAFTQATTSNSRTYYINMLEGQPQLSDMRRRHYQSRQTHGDMAETHNAHRFENTVDLWLSEAAYQPEPLFVSVGLENFVNSADWNEANRRGVRYFCAQAKNRRVVFAQAADIADFYQRHYRRQPESWFYWPDMYAGLLAGHKPRQVPDRIELSNATFHSLHEDGAALPRFLWDYTRPWDEPVWDDQRAIRQKFGLVTLGLLNATNCVPRMVGLDGVTATIALDPHPRGGVAVQVRVDTPCALGALPLGVWRIPLKAGSCEAEGLPQGARFVPVVDGSTDNLHGVLVCGHVRKGSHAWTFRLRGEPRQPVEPGFRVGDEVRGRCFYRASGPTAYVWLADGCARRVGTLAIRVPEGRPVKAYYNDGQVVQPKDGLLRIMLGQGWQYEAPMVSGLTAAEIQAAADFQPDAERKETTR